MRRAALLAALAALLAAGSARAVPLLVDLSEHLVAITAGFTGTNVLVFGAVDEEGDLAIVVKGPERDITVRRKERVLGVWVNRSEITYVRAPTFYAVASTRPLAELASPEVLQRHGIGLDHLRLEKKADLTAAEEAAFRDGLVRSKRRDGLYSAEPSKIAFLTGRLFRSDLRFPANVPPGAYSVEVYLFRNGEVVSAQTTPLAVGNVGVGADVFLFAHRHAALYGAASIAVALLAGWAASVAFRRS